MTLNVNVMNPFGTTMAARTFDDIRYTGSINVDADRQDISGIAEWIDRKFPKLEAGLVLSRSGERRITVNLGSEDGVQIGMGVLIAARGDDVKDPQTGELLGSNIYVGEAYVVAVDEGTCEAKLALQSEPQKGADGRPMMADGQLLVEWVVPNVRVHDKIIFK
jgi:hypothetical protein